MLRPDMTRAVGVLSRCNAGPNEVRITAAKGVCRYLKGPVVLILVCSTTELCDIFGYSDAAA